MKSIPRSNLWKWALFNSDIIFIHLITILKIEASLKYLKSNITYKVPAHRNIKYKDKSKI